MIISAKELYNQIGKSKSRPIIVDARTFGEYKKGHIPGAINIDLFQLHWFDTSKTGIKDFNRQSRILLSNIGIKKKSHVVFYDDISGVSAARGVWLLLYFSHKIVSMLDGGFEVWKRSGYPIEIQSNPLIHSEFKGKIDNNVLSTAAEVKKSIKDKRVVILDARSNEEFNGSDVRAARYGHIPFAVNIDWQRNIENSSFKNKEKLSKIYCEIPKNSKIITYCQGGYRAANSFLVLKMLGYKNAKMYLGSWGEWGNRLDLPVSD
ncbi:MAG TPA: sulfurtransferase [Nitrososphaeraceae archaeon]|nr:sulfurtransferase [Nitrososphaeraceae archaeon]